MQLVDTEGDPISSKEYLEKALESQKGFTDDIEKKNRIRRLLQTFFPERDCLTMVRPLLDEKKLQNLEKMEINKLRPEFFEQVVNLRKKIMNKMKPKMLNDQNLNGEMYMSLVNNYTNAINDGTVPNIENAWNYLCRDECMKAVEFANETYQKNLVELVYPKIPTTLDDLKVKLINFFFNKLFLEYL